MTSTPLPETKDPAAFDRSAALPTELHGSRDVRAQKRGLLAMLLDRQLLLRFLNGLTLAAIDLLLLFASLMIALRVKTISTADASSLQDSYGYAVKVLPFAALVMLLLFAGDGLYKQRNLRPGAARILGSLFKVTIVTLIFALVEGERFQSYYVFWATFIVASGLIVGARVLYDRAAERLEDAFGRERRAVIVGNNQQIEAVAEALERAPVQRIKPVGFSTLDKRAENGLRDLGPLDSIEDHFDEIDEVIIADPTFPAEETVILVDRCHRGGVHVRVAPTTMEILRADVAEFVPGETLPLFEIKPPVFEGAQFVVKRLFDIVVSTLLLVIFSPLLACTALAVRLTSRGPVFYPSPRPGLGGENFNCIKFRTMVTNAEELLANLMERSEGAGPLFKMKRDPRVTRMGSFLRKTSLDELPQLWNVLRNEMSLVGPRPALRSEMAEWSDELYARLRVKPGITGMWQVSGRSSTTFEEYTRLDLYYVDNWSLVVDLAILVKTIPAVVASRGAY